MGALCGRGFHYQDRAVQLLLVKFRGLEVLQEIVNNPNRLPGKVLEPAKNQAVKLLQAAGHNQLILCTGQDGANIPECDPPLDFFGINPYLGFRQHIADTGNGETDPIHACPGQNRNALRVLHQGGQDFLDW